MLIGLQGRNESQSRNEQKDCEQPIRHVVCVGPQKMDKSTAACEHSGGDQGDDEWHTQRLGDAWGRSEGPTLQLAAEFRATNSPMVRPETG